MTKPFSFEEASQPAAPFSHDEAQGKTKGFASDAVNALKQGALQLPGAATGLADIPAAALGFNRPFSKAADSLGAATGFKPGQWAKDAEADYSQATQAGKAEIDAVWEDPNAGALDVAKAYATNPRVTALNAIQSIPSMLAGGVAGRVVGGVGGIASAPIRAGIGEGAVMAGQSMADIDPSVDPQRAAAAAAAVGVGGAALGFAGGKIADRLGVLDVDAALAGGAGAKATAPSVLKRVPTGAAQEGLLEELPQSLLEKGAQNWAEEKPLTEGLARAGVEGTLAGGLMGGVGGFVPAAKRPGGTDAPGTEGEKAGKGPSGDAIGLIPAQNPADPSISATSTIEAERTGTDGMDGAPPPAPGPLADPSTVDPNTGEVVPAPAPAPVVAPPMAPGEPPTVIDPNAGPLSKAASIALGSPLATAAATAQAPVAPGAAPAAPAAPSAPATFASEEEAASYISKQRRAGGMRISALPMPNKDGTFGIAVKGTPDYTVAEFHQRAKANQGLGVLDGDILNKSGAPFKNRLQATKAMRDAGDGHQIVQLGESSFVVRKGAPADAQASDTAPSRVISSDTAPPVPPTTVNQPQEQDRADQAPQAQPSAAQPDPPSQARTDVARNTQPASPAPLASLPQDGVQPAAPAAAPVAPATATTGANGKFPPTTSSGSQREDGNRAGENGKLPAVPGGGEDVQVPDANGVSVAAPSAPLDVAANEAATSPLNDRPEPTDAQKEAGNYKVGRVKVGGLDLSIENPAGSVRRGTDRDGKAWENTLQHHYGYIRRSEGNDGDHVDAFVKPGTPEDWEGTVFVVDQVHPDTKAFDEHKAMVGFDSLEDAKQAYRANYAKDWRGMQAISALPMGEFKTWVMDREATKQPLVKVSQPTSVIDKMKNKAAEKVADVEPDGLVVIPADEEAFADALNDLVNKSADTETDSDSTAKPGVDPEVLDWVDGERKRDQATFDPDIAPVNLQRDVEKVRTKLLAPDQAKAELEKWKAEADRQGSTSVNANRTVISLFDASGVLAQPWVDAGYNVVTYDLQSGADISTFDAENLLDQHGNDEIWAILAQPPCTDFASSGARWWKEKDADGRTEASNELVRQVLRTVELFRPPVWVMENPVGRIKRLNALPNTRLQFDPWHFGDDYTKRTLLWGKFDPSLPTAMVDPVQGSKMHKLSSSAKYERSLTPEGFSYAFFMANNAESFPLGKRLAWEFAGVEQELFDAAVEAGVSEGDIRSAIEDSYYDNDLIGVADELKALADKPAKKAEPAPAPAPAKRKPAQVIDNGATNPGEFIVRDGATNLARFAVGSRGQAVGIRYFHESQQTRGFAQEAIDAFIAERNKSEPTASPAPKPEPEKKPNVIDKMKAAKAQAEPADKAEKAKAKNQPIAPTANTIFTEDAAEKARALLKRKLGQLSSGIDPEIVQAGITLAGYHIERGARTFAAYAQAMLADLGETVRPYLKSWYMGVKYDPRSAALDGLDSAATVEATDVDALGAQAPADDTEADPAQNADQENIDDSPTSTDTPALDTDLAGGQRADTGQPTRGAKRPRASNRRRNDAGVQQGGGLFDGIEDEGRDLGNARGNDPAPDGQDDALAADLPDPSAGRDFRVPDGGLTRTGTWLETATRNLDLIDLARDIESQGRPATPEEQAQLSKYVGFGASAIRNAMFPVPPDWQRRARPGALIYPEAVREPKWLALAERAAALPIEWQRTILQTTQYQHFTSEGIIRSIWAAMVDRLGFTGGKIFEPGTGIGSFAMTMPDSVRATSRFTGIEFDAPTALIARLLSPGQNMLHDDFIKRKLPADYFDIVIGNPPFSQTPVLGDPDYEKHKFFLHDFFFAKAMDKLRPGGVLAFVTSKGTMDKQTDKARKYLAARADLLGAIRLPSTAFEENAGTSVVTDVIFLRKRAQGEAEGGQAWRGLKTVETKDGPVVINEYFADHPDMVLGQNRISGNEDDLGRRINSNGRGGEKYTVVSYDANIAELEAKFQAAIEALPANAYSPLKQDSRSVRRETAKADFNPLIKRDGVIYVRDGEIMRVENGVGVALGNGVKLSDKDVEWLKSYIGLRDLVQLARLAQFKDENWEKPLKDVNKAYDDFVKKHGPINDYRVLVRTNTNEDGEEVQTQTRIYKNKRLFSNDYDAPIVTQLEFIDEDGNFKKSAFLKGRTIGKPVERKVETIGDALAVSLDELGTLDIADVGRRIGLSTEDAIDALGAQVYKTPQGEWQLADEYLSGDVVRKLDEATVAARVDPSIERNIKALQDVQPERLGPSQIGVKLGASWVDARHVNDFAKLIEAGEVTFDAKTESWQVEGATLRSERRAGAEYGTARRSPSELLETALNSRPIKIYDTVDKKQVLNSEATTAAVEMIKKIKEKFKSWVWTDTDRAAELVESYNLRYNNIAPRRFDGSHLTLPGVSLRYSLHAHQLRAIWRQIQTGNTYLAHAVGAGKTIEMIAGGMEQRRLGLIRKPAYVVPNHMLEQFANEFMDLYPLANILVADDHNFSKERRKSFLAAATLNAPDAIIITHSAFEKIGVKEESVAPIRDEILDDLRDELDGTAKDAGSRVRRQQLEQQIEAVTQRFDSIVAAGKKDGVVSFEEMGVDHVFVDEAHTYRKLDFHTSQQIKGIDPNGSKRALDMYVKTRWLEKKNPGRSMTFASGTPVTNTMGEIYTILRFFAPAMLERDGITTFDGWSRMFGEVKAALEQNASGKYEIVERFAKFENVPELMSRVRQFMDVLQSDQLGAVVKRPDLKGFKPNLVLVQPTKALKTYQDGVLQTRLAISRAWKPSFDQPTNPDPVIAIITDGRFAATDPRFIPGGRVLPGEQTKMDEAAKRIADNYKATAGNVYVDRDGKPMATKGSTQLVFFNVGFGATSSANRGFDSRGAFTKAMIANGVKREHIAWFEDADTDAKKEAIFKAMRNGTVRVLIGSAKKMGTGVNVQNRLIKLHYMDPPWFPADVEQPHGRIIRQGNQNPEVEIDWYATKGGYDATMWQMVGRKQRFIDQAFSGDKNLRSMEDLGEASQYEEAAALASGDPRALQLAGLKQDVERAERLQAAHASEQISARSNLRTAQWEIESADKKIAIYKEALKALGTSYFTFKSGTVGSAVYDKFGEFGTALKTAVNEFVTAQATEPTQEAKSIAKIGHLAVEVTTDFDWVINAETKERALLPTGFTDLWVPVGSYKVHVDRVRMMGAATDAAGLVKRMVNAINEIDSDLRRNEKRRADSEIDITRLKKKIGAPFEHQQEMLEKQKELVELEAILKAEGEAANAQAAQQAKAAKAAAAAAAPPSDLDAAALSRSGRPAPYVSALRKSIADMKAAGMPAGMWKSAIQGLVNKGQAKADEVEWSGLNEWLGLQQGKVTKDQVLAYLDANGVRVEEVMMGGRDAFADLDKAIAEADALGFSFARDQFEDGDEYSGRAIQFERRSDGVIFGWNGSYFLVDAYPQNMQKDDIDHPQDALIDVARDIYALAEDERIGVDADGSKYSKYTLPGGKNYREVLLTLPQREPEPLRELPEGYEVSVNRWLRPEDGIYTIIPPGQQHGQPFAGVHKTVEAAKDAALARLNASRRTKALDGGYRSSHWDQPNVLAHIRLNDRTDADGKRVLFVEEVQADKGQEWQKLKVKIAKGTATKEDQERFEFLDKNFPFNATDKWLTLALKRILVMAAQEGYDRVAFINGEQSAERYSLDKHVGSVTYVPGMNGGTLLATDLGDNSFVIKETNVTPEKVADFVGKDVAEKLMAQPIKDGSHKLTGSGLKVPQGGMRAFYDTIVPNTLKPLLKKVGGGQLDEVTIDQGGLTSARIGAPDDAWPFVVYVGDREVNRVGTRDIAEEEVADLRARGKNARYVQRLSTETQQPGFTITPEMRERLVGGMPLFRAQGQTGGMSVEAARKIIDAKVGKWKNGPRVVVVATPKDLPMQAPDDANGVYHQGTVYIVAGAHRAEGQVLRTLAHEAVAHFGLRGMLGDGYAKFLNQMQLGIKMGNQALIALRDEVRSRYEGLSTLQEADEIAALAIERGLDPATGDFRTGFAWLKSWFAKIAQFLRTELGILIPVTNAELQGMLVRANRFVQGSEQAGQEQGDPVASFSRGGNNDIAFSRGSMESTLKATVQTSIRKAGNTLADYRGLALGSLGRRQLVDLYTPDLPQLPEYSDLVQRMDADKNEAGAEADALARRWALLKDERQLAELMHDATLAQIDPAMDRPRSDLVGDQTMYDQLRAQFMALSEDARKVYTDARDAYKSHHKKVRAAIRERVLRSELSSARRAEMLARLDAEFFEAIRGVYFPLARFGDYVVLVRDRLGNVVSVSRAETLNEAEALRAQLRQAYPDLSVGKVLKDREFNAGRDSVGRGFMETLFAAFDRQDLNANQRAEIEDMLGQLYLSALPDLSWAKHGIHRKGTPGFSQDARRAFAMNMFHGARYLAKTRYSDLLDGELSAMQKHVAARSDDDRYDSVRAQQVVDEMVKRHDSMMNPKTNALSTALTSLGFVFHLGLSPASAMVNLSQTALVAYPLMGAKWGYGKASAALLRASAEAAKFKNDLGGALKGDEKKAFDEAVRAGTIDVTMAHDLAGIAQGEDQRVAWRLRPVMRWASFLFHHAEKFNRQVTFMAAYRLARAAGTGHVAAFEQATKATYDGHFDYAASNRPRFMQGNIARVLLLFKQYGQNMVYTLGRQAQLSIHGTPAQKAEARKALAGLLTMHGAAAGVLGLPLVSPLLAAASMLGGGEDEPWDAEVALRNMLADAIGQKPAEVLTRGFSRLTPWDISARVGLDHLILPDVQEGLEGRRFFESASTALLGPVAGIGLNVGQGLQEISQGQFARGLETMMPSALRGPMRAVRYANEGAQDKTGISLVDEVGAAGIAGQALGLRPSNVALATEGKGAIYQADRRLKERRAQLLREYALAVMETDMEKAGQARSEIMAFNEKNPAMRINPIQMAASVKARRNRIDQAEQGVYLPKNRREALEAGRFAVTE